jgi:SsrA-binding protein
MGMEDPHDLEPPRLGVAIRPEVVGGVHRVDPSRGGGVPGRVHDSHLARPGVPTQQPARFVGQPGEAVTNHLSVDLGGEAEHGGRLLVGPPQDGSTLGHIMAKSRTRSKAAHRDGNDRQVARNRRARHDYDVLDTYECGIALKGGEVKSVRAGRVNLKDGYARVEHGEVWLHGVHVAPYAFSHGVGEPDPDRPRKLLMHRREIDELIGRTQQQSLTLVPLTLYFKAGKAKVELALARGRRNYDKRRALAERDAKREAARALAGRERE